MAYIDEELQRMQQRIKQEEAATNPVYNSINRDIKYDEFFKSNITNSLLKTMAISYSETPPEMTFQTIIDNMTSTTANKTSFPLSGDSYLDWCKRILDIDPDEPFNSSSNRYINGVHIRVYATLKPYTKYPQIVISTTKEPPEKIKTLSEADEQKLKEIVKDNFVVVGQSGAGKTFLMNYILKKYYPKNKRVGMFQEFAELVPPNGFTDQFLVPPSKPDQQYSHLEHLVKNSNLQRYDSIFVGEIKGSEAWPFVTNLASGTNGGATLHGTDAQNAIRRLRILCLLSRVNLSEKAVDTMIAKALNYVITVKDGQVASIEKILTSNNGNFSLEDVRSASNEARAIRL